MEVFGLLNLKSRSRSQTCRTKITLRHPYYKLPRLNLDTQAFLISIPEMFALFIGDRTSIIDVRHFDRVFSKFPYIGPVLDPSPSHLPLPPFFFFFSFSSAWLFCFVRLKSIVKGDFNLLHFTAHIQTFAHLGLPYIRYEYLCVMWSTWQDEETLKNIPISLAQMQNRA